MNRSPLPQYQSSASTPMPTGNTASVSEHAYMQKFMPQHLRDPFLDQPNYAHALISPEFDATRMHQSVQDQARDQARWLSDRKRNAKFHRRMTLLMVLLLVGPFAVGVILEMQDMNSQTAVRVVILGWVLAIVLTPVWIVMGINRSNEVKTNFPSVLTSSELGMSVRPYNSKY